MRVSPISNYQKAQNYKHSSNFKGKNDCAKLIGGIAGSLGTAGAIGGTILMTGGISLPFVLAYGGLCTLLGAGVGHAIDKDSSDSHNKYDKNSNP